MVTLPGVPLGHTDLPTPLRFPERSCFALQIDPAGILHALGCWPTSRGLVVTLPRLLPQTRLSLVLKPPWETAPHWEQKASPPAVHSLWEGWRFIIQLRVVVAFSQKQMRNYHLKIVNFVGPCCPGCSCCQLGPILRLPGHSWCLSCPLPAPSWGQLGPSWACLGPFGDHLAPSWPIVRPTCSFTLISAGPYCLSQVLFERLLAFVSIRNFARPGCPHDGRAAMSCQVCFTILPD